MSKIREMTAGSQEVATLRQSLKLARVEAFSCQMRPGFRSQAE